MKKRNLTQKIFLLFSLLIFFTIVIAATMKNNDQPLDEIHSSNLVADDSAKSIQAFGQVYQVLMSPRCMNCHPAGDTPLQGDDSHLHAMGPQRGVEGKGLYAMKCANCHQDTNVGGDHTPPGNPDWHLPPAETKMVFEGRSPHELAMQLVDPEKNGHKDMEDLIEHASDTLVIAGWNMGGDRTPPPLSYEEFKEAWITWIETGAYAPKEE